MNHSPRSSSISTRSSVEVLQLPTFQLQCCSLFSRHEKDYNTVVEMSAIEELLLNFGLERHEKDYNTVVETLTIEELLLNFGLELKKLRDEFSE